MNGNDHLVAIEFIINGKTFKVNVSDVDPETKLVDFLRRSALLTGTKWTCREGGCGACMVTIASPDPIKGTKEYRSVNSCLMPLLSCHGSEIITVEGIGNKKDGYHPIQSRLADMNGTQCGYCSPGMVMSGFSLMERKGTSGFTMKDVEDALDGNICRCTGYRPILDAFKSFANDAPPGLVAANTCVDLEDLQKTCRKTGDLCSGSCRSGGQMFQTGNWYRPESLAQLTEILGTFDPQSKYRLVAGNTGTGVYKNDGPYAAYVDVTRVQELYQVDQTTPLTIGGGVTLANLSDILISVGSSNPDYWYGSILAEHVTKIGSTPVRNNGSIAGNLMLKHAHNEFPSDLFIILETVGAKLNLLNRTGKKQQVGLTNFLQTNMQGVVIVNVVLPPLSKDHVVKTFKIMPRASNAHAYINAGFLARIQSNRIMEKPTIVFGGIRPSLIHAERTEEFLNGKNLEDENEFQAALKVLDAELDPAGMEESNPDYLVIHKAEDEPLNPEEDPLAPNLGYLKTVAQGLLYKFVLSILGDKVDGRIRSGALNLERGLSSGKQDFDTDNKEWPVSKPTIKVEAKAQCSGEAQYVDDIPVRPDELHGAFVISTVANCQIDSIDPSEALKAEGVVAYLDANNIKEGNKFVIAPKGRYDTDEDEEIFCSGKVKYAGQSLGLIVAKTQIQAMRAAKLVQVKYKELQKPVLTIRDALQYPERIIDHGITQTTGNMDEGWKSSEKIIEGEFEIGGQYHFYMENLVAICIPVEDGMDLYCSTQDPNKVQSIVADCLRIKKAQINIQVRRLGGGYGGKISRPILLAAASAIAATELSRPVRIQLDLNTNMALIGGRLPYYCKYKAGVDKDGLLQAVDLTIISDTGYSFTEGTSAMAVFFGKNCYSSKAWRLSPKLAKTDTPSNTYCRAPGSTQGIAIIENLMEHLAKVCKEDPLEYRLKNMNMKDNEVESLKKIMDQLRESSNYEERLRQVKEFNMNNRWKKRGINLLPMIYPQNYPPFRYNAQVAILHNGGSVLVSHGGIEMGQGINTKVSQVVARELGLDMSMVFVKPTNSLTNANGSVSAGSITSELTCYAVMKACQELKERMRPIKEKLPAGIDWATLVEKCHFSNVDMTARHLYSANDKLTGYVVHGATVSEVEVDVLTGEKLIHRVDILEDAGQSMSPLVDIGQVEGAFIMGVGLWTSEKITYDPVGGQKLTSGTWNYKPPLSDDIPVDFRVTLLKNAAHPFGVLRSKATGEPPSCMSVSVFFALRNAVDYARNDAHSEDSDWYQFDGPATIDKLHRTMLTKPGQFVFH